MINNFFTEIDFTNPRRVKKVLNKFQMLRDFRSMKSNKIEDFPNIDMKSNSENGLFETILILYLIIIHEFFQNDFDNFLDFDKKRDIYSSVTSSDSQYKTLNSSIQNNLSNTHFAKIYNIISSGVSQINDVDFFICLSPINIKQISYFNLEMGKGHEIRVSGKQIDFLFFKYINKRKTIDWLQYSQNSTTLVSIKNLIKNFL